MVTKSMIKGRKNMFPMSMINPRKQMFPKSLIPARKNMFSKSLITARKKMFPKSLITARKNMFSKSLITARKNTLKVLFNQTISARVNKHYLIYVYIEHSAGHNNILYHIMTIIYIVYSVQRTPDMYCNRSRTWRRGGEVVS